MNEIVDRIAQELNAQASQVRDSVALLDSGASVPFIARYRKEATGGLDDAQLRLLQTRLQYLRELHERREAILKSIAEQGKLTPQLQSAIQAADNKQVLEDLYLPYKPRRRTKGQIAREFGIEPLADLLWADPRRVPEQEAQAFVHAEKGEGGEDFGTAAAVLDGVRDILSERWAEDAALVQALREWLWAEGVLQSRLAAGQDEQDPEVARFRDYFDYSEAIGKIPSHRALAVFRGRKKTCLNLKLLAPQPEGQEDAPHALAEGRIARQLGFSHQGRASDDLLQRCISWTWRVKLSLSLERELFTRLREQAEDVAIEVFASNLRDVLLAAPAGQKTVMGLDPGIRTGVKVAVVDATGKLLETATIYPHEPRRQWEQSLHSLLALVQKHGVQLIAIGNGTASRQTDRLAADLIARMKQDGLAPLPEKVVVSEAGASVYSASEYASQELPQLDVSLRGAVSIARRLQDPLAELVKIEPKSIGVGQYQHDVNQRGLGQALDAVVEDCVNGVGVDVNTASDPLLQRVSGLSPSVARAIVHWREQHGAFDNRRQLLKVSGLGPKSFEQSAGFLRIRGGNNPLDATGVHPETYPLVEQILLQKNCHIDALMGKKERLQAIRPEDFVTPEFGVVTVRDILLELEKPGRDPRGHFQVARFNEGVNEVRDLKPGMMLEGTVTNVAAFGAFVDVGVHQDGLVHVSQLADRFVRDAHEVVKTGQIVQVRVLEVDEARGRVSLSMKKNPEIGAAPVRSGNKGKSGETAPGRRRPERGRHRVPGNSSAQDTSAFAGLRAALAAQAQDGKSSKSKRKK